MPTRVSLIRHGHVHNPQRILYGRLPGFGLSERGRAEAQVMAAAVRELVPSPSVLYSSPLLRARQTAAAVLAQNPHLKLHISSLLSEVHTSFQGRPLTELEQLKFDLYIHNLPGYEQPQDVLTRMRQFIARMRRRHAGEHVLAVTHGDPITFVIQWAVGLPIGPRWREALVEFGLSGGYPATVSMTTLTFESDNPDERPMLNYAEPVTRSITM